MDVPVSIVEHIAHDQGLALLGRVVREAARTKEDLADLINVGIEELIRESFELPGFTTSLEEAQRGRADVNRALCTSVHEALGMKGREQIDRLGRDPGIEARTMAGSVANRNGRGLIG